MDRRAVGSRLIIPREPEQAPLFAVPASPDAPAMNSKTDQRRELQACLLAESKRRTAASLPSSVFLGSALEFALATAPLVPTRADSKVVARETNIHRQPWPRPFARKVVELVSVRYSKSSSASPERNTPS